MSEFHERMAVVETQVKDILRRLGNIDERLNSIDDKLSGNPGSSNRARLRAIAPGGLTAGVVVGIIEGLRAIFGG